MIIKKELKNEIICLWSLSVLCACQNDFRFENQAVELDYFALWRWKKRLADLVGKKMLPILVKEDAEPGNAESLEIVHYVDAFYGEKLCPDSAPEIEAWMKRRQL